MIFLNILLCHFIGSIFFLLYDAHIGIHLCLSDRVAKRLCIIWEIILICNFFYFFGDYIKNVKEDRLKKEKEDRLKKEARGY